MRAKEIEKEQTVHNQTRAIYLDLCRTPSAGRSPRRKGGLWLGALACALGALIVSVPSSVHAQSLFPLKKAKQNSRGSSAAGLTSLYGDIHAHSVGDVLTVTIAENTSATSTATTKTAQDDNVSAFGGTGLVQSFFRSLTLSATNSRSGDGTGSTTRAGSLVTTLSVLVKEVLPNGTLRIEGTRVVGINRETQKVTFSGIVRPEDIASDNSIASNLIAGVEVRYDGKGLVSEQQRPGILARVFRFLF
jgi:flagellar L-ring protein precursor FlgH